MPLEIIDSTFEFFEEMEIKCENLSSCYRLGAVSLCVTPIKKSIQAFLLSWRNTLGQAVFAKTLQEVLLCREKIQVYTYCSNSLCNASVKDIYFGFV